MLSLKTSSDHTSLHAVPAKLDTPPPSPPTKQPPSYIVHLLSPPSAPTTFLTPTALLRPDSYHPASLPHLISTLPLETYGPRAPSVIRIGNGGLGPTGLLRALCLAYLESHDLLGRTQIQWVCNHSRYSQVALLADVVDIALTYERGEEAIMESEGWGQVAGVMCHDHFVLVGPKDDPAGIAGCKTLGEAMRRLAEAARGSGAAGSVGWHTRGDGSATMHKEQSIWAAAGVAIDYARPGVDGAWYGKHPLPPLAALIQAEKDHCYTLNDRATVVLAKNKGEIKNTAVFVEGGEVLMNTCKAVLRSGEARKKVLALVEWLMGEEAERLVEGYGREWGCGAVLFTRKDREEVEEQDELKKLFPPMSSREL